MKLFSHEWSGENKACIFHCSFLDPGLYGNRARDDDEIGI